MRLCISTSCGVLKWRSISIFFVARQWPILFASPDSKSNKLPKEILILRSRHRPVEDTFLRADRKRSSSGQSMPLVRRPLALFISRGVRTVVLLKKLPDLNLSSQPRLFSTLQPLLQRIDRDTHHLCHPIIAELRSTYIMSQRRQQPTFGPLVHAAPPKTKSPYVNAAARSAFSYWTSEGAAEFDVSPVVSA